MRLISNVSDESIQRHTIPLQDENITLIIRFYSVIQIWTMDCTYKGVTVRGTKCTVGSLHFAYKNWPFDFVFDDLSTAKIDPYKSDDFTSGRMRMFYLEPQDMVLIRGYAVEI